MKKVLTLWCLLAILGLVAYALVTTATAGRTRAQLVLGPTAVPTAIQTVFPTPVATLLPTAEVTKVPPTFVPPTPTTAVPTALPTKVLPTPTPIPTAPVLAGWPWYIPW